MAERVVEDGICKNVFLLEQSLETSFGTQHTHNKFDGCKVVWIWDSAASTFDIWKILQA
jgi:hypothetical protein